MGKILSVYFTDEEIRICELQKSGKHTGVSKAVQVSIPSGVVEDGMILDVEQAAQCLSAAITNNRLKKGKLAFVISSRKIANKEIILPYVKNPQKITEMIMANIDEYFPMNNLDEYLFRHEILDTFETEGGKQNSLLVMAVQKQMVEGYYQVAAELKMSVYTVDYYGNSVHQLLKHQMDASGTVLVLQMDKSHTYVSIMKGKAQLFKRSIPYGYDSVVRNFSELKSIDRETAADALSNAVKMDNFLTKEDFQEIIREFTSSITRVVEFHVNRNPDTVLEQVKLLGAGVNIVGMPEILAEELGLDVVPIKELKDIKIIGKKGHQLQYEELSDYLANLGVLFEPLNLKIEEDKKKKTGSGYGALIALTIVAAIATGAVCGVIIYEKMTLEKKKQQLNEELGTYTTAEATYKDYLAVKNRYEVLDSYYESTKSPSEMFYRMIIDMEEMMPESVGIVDISLKDGAVEMTGVSAGKEPLAAFVMELKKLPYITGIHVDSILDVTTELDDKISTFNMKWQLVLTEETAEESETNGIATDAENEEGGPQ